MSMGTPPANEPGGEGGIDPSVAKAIAWMGEALSILDSLDYPPEIGARLQEVIERASAEARRRS